MSHKAGETNQLHCGLTVENKKKRSRRKGHDIPLPGWRRWSCHVQIELLEQFKAVAETENKSLKAALDEALKNWVNFENED